MPHQKSFAQHIERFHRNFTRIEILITPKPRKLWRSSTPHMRCCPIPINVKNTTYGLPNKSDYRRNRRSRIVRRGQHNDKHPPRHPNQRRLLVVYSPTFSETGLFMESRLSSFGFGRLTSQEHLRRDRSHIKPVRHHQCDRNMCGQTLHQTGSLGLFLLAMFRAIRNSIPMVCLLLR